MQINECCINKYNIWSGSYTLTSLIQRYVLINSQEVKKKSFFFTKENRGLDNIFLTIFPFG